MTAALEGGEWSAVDPGRTLPQGKTQYQFYRRLGGPQGRSGRVENLVPTGIGSRTVQPVVSRYNDGATRPTIIRRILILIIISIMIIPVIIGATGIVTKSLRKNLETIPGKHSIDSLQKTAILGTSHIIRKVLQCEA